ncbi:hypothetical protein FGIG_12520 [Fasciola gigantica]|uniref:Uncharacterized protein n=1 Tax=Fasciola gigantica TaxID=46835 RepID=A0A504Y839_FASGI|nr:hypothetical protein FGIG_12520 [Fasciola gigantica]
MRTNWVEEARHAHFNISIQRESLTHFNEEERNELLNGIAKNNNGMISNGESSRRNGLIPLFRNHLLENRQAFKRMNVKDRLTRCQLVLKCPSGGFPMRILLFFSLFCYWFAAIYISVSQPPAVWRLHCSSLAGNLNHSLPSFCDRMYREDQYFPFNLLPLKIPDPIKFVTKAPIV